MRDDGALEIRRGDLHASVPRVLVCEQTSQSRYILGAEIDDAELSWR